MQYDICIKCTEKSVLIAALAPYGLTVTDESGQESMLTASLSHALSYAGRVIQTPAVIDISTGGVTAEATYLPGEYAVLRADEVLLREISEATLEGVEILTEPPAGCPTFGGWRVLPAVDIQVARDAACARLNARRDAIKYGVFTDSHGVRYDVHRDARDNFDGVESKIANGLVLSAGFTWTDADNTERPHDNASFLALTMEILLWSQAVHAACVAAKRAVRDDAADLAGVATAEAAVSWP